MPFPPLWESQTLSLHPSGPFPQSKEKEMFIWKGRPGCPEMKPRFGQKLDEGSPKLGLLNELEKSGSSG